MPAEQQMKDLIGSLEEGGNSELAMLILHLYSRCCHSDVPEWSTRMAKASFDAILVSEST